MTSFHILNLKAALGDVELASSTPADGYDALPAALKVVDSCEKPLGDHGWLDIEHAHNGTRFTDALSALHLHAEAQSMWLNLLRQRTMCAYGMLMQAILVDGVAIAMQGLKRHRDICLPQQMFATDCTCVGGTGGQTWVLRLAIAIYHNLSSRTDHWEMRSVDFLPALIPPTSYSHTLGSQRTRSYDILSDETIKAASEEVTNVLVCWFNVGTHNTALIRLLFIKTLLQRLGPGALLLDSTWKLFRQAPAWLLPSKARGVVYRGGRLDMSTVLVIDSLLNGYPVGHTTSKERNLLGELQGAYNSLTQGPDTSVRYANGLTAKYRDS